eukprot:7218252-Prymnesium_polylepis.1
MTAFRFRCDRAQLVDLPPSGLSMMEWTVNVRSRLYQLPFGDQALATTAATLAEVGGYPDFPLLEEYELVNRFRKLSAGGAGHI